MSNGTALDTLSKLADSITVLFAFGMLVAGIAVATAGMAYMSDGELGMALSAGVGGVGLAALSVLFFSAFIGTMDVRQEDTQTVEISRQTARTAHRELEAIIEQTAVEEPGLLTGDALRARDELADTLEGQTDG